MTTFRDAIAYLLGFGTFLVAASSCAAPPLPLGGATGLGAGAALRDRAAGYEVTVLVDGVPAPTYGHDGETYLLGQLGSRYTVRVTNHSGRRIEAVVSVDGRDVIDGKPAELRSKRGYLVPAFGQVDIDGWRISQAEAAAFRFSSVPDSYAARTGSAREVGVIGVAVFPERYVPPPPPVHSYPYYPQPQRQYDRTPYGRGELNKSEGAADDRDSVGGSGPSSSPSAPAPAAAPPASASAGHARGADPAEAEMSRDEAPSKKSPRRRSGLGTEYGEAVSSPVYEVEFVRANPGRPSVILGLRYNDRQGLLALGIDVDGPDWASDHEQALRRTAEPFPAAHRRFAAPPPGWRE